MVILLFKFTISTFFEWDSNYLVMSYCCCFSLIYLDLDIILNCNIFLRFLREFQLAGNFFTLDYLFLATIFQNWHPQCKNMIFFLNGQGNCFCQFLYLFYFYVHFTHTFTYVHKNAKILFF